jgi:hypothetical protein
MTITRLKALNVKNGGTFFSRDCMRFFGDTMKSFSIKTLDNGNIQLTRKRSGKVWEFSAETGRWIFPENP